MRTHTHSGLLERVNTHCIFHTCIQYRRSDLGLAATPEHGVSDEEGSADGASVGEWDWASAAAQASGVQALCTVPSVQQSCASADIVGLLPEVFFKSLLRSPMHTAVRTRPQDAIRCTAKLSVRQQAEDVDARAWRAEAERVAGRLRAALPDAAGGWRGGLEAARRGRAALVAAAAPAQAALACIAQEARWAPPLCCKHCAARAPVVFRASVLQRWVCRRLCAVLRRIMPGGVHTAVVLCCCRLCPRDCDLYLSE